MKKAMKDMTPQELLRMKQQKEDFQLIDVREDWEYQQSNLGGLHIPMQDIEKHKHKLSRSKKVVVHCHHGRRSAAVIQKLESDGFQNLFNLKGGIHAYSLEADPAVPTY